MTPRHNNHDKVVPSAHLHRRPMLILSCDDDDDNDDDEEVVRDGPRKGGKEESTSSSSGQSPGQPPNQPPGEPTNQPPDQAPNQRPTQSSTPPEPSGAQGEGVGEQPPQFTDYSRQITHRRLMTFAECSDVGNSMAVQDRESSDNVNEQNYCSSVKEFCIPQPESCSSRPRAQSNSQSDELDGRCFRSPAQSQGSSRNSMQSSEYFTVSHILMTNYLMTMVTSGCGY